MRFRDRSDAGRRLAALLGGLRGARNLIVLGLPRGGVPVAYEVARALDAPLDVFVVRKLGVPGQEELAMGAIASGGHVILNEEVLAGLGVPESQVEQIAQRELQEVLRREQAYRGERPPPALERATVVVVDDGLATGATMRAAVEAIRNSHPARIVVAVPVASPEALTIIAGRADEVHCLSAPPFFYAVGAWYEDFAQTSDEQVQELLDRAGQSGPAREG